MCTTYVALNRSRYRVISVLTYIWMRKLWLRCSHRARSALILQLRLVSITGRRQNYIAGLPCMHSKSNEFFRRGNTSLRRQLWRRMEKNVTSSQRKQAKWLEERAAHRLALGAGLPRLVSHSYTSHYLWCGLSSCVTNCMDGWCIVQTDDNFRISAENT